MVAVNVKILPSSFKLWRRIGDIHFGTYFSTSSHLNEFRRKLVCFASYPAIRPSTKTLAPTSRSLLSASSTVITPILRSLETNSREFNTDGYDGAESEVLDETAVRAFRGFAGQSLPQCVGCRSLASRFGWLLLAEIGAFEGWTLVLMRNLFDLGVGLRPTQRETNCRWLSACWIRFSATNSGANCVTIESSACLRIVILSS